MVLGSKAGGLTYSKSMYLSTSPFGFFYVEGSLAFPFGRWTEGDDQWIAELFGLSWEKRLKPDGMDGEEAWEEYIKRVEGYLKRGIPVQTFWNWTPNREEKKQDKIVTPSGERAFWWEGLTEKTRPDTHNFVVVGLDRANHQVRVNMPSAGWFGLEKYRTINLNYLKKRIETLRQNLKYTTIAYVPTEKPRKNDQEMEKGVSHRILKKIQGDPDAYFSERNQRYQYGINALKAFKEDLNVSRFFQILDKRAKRQDLSCLEILVWVKLGLYQMKFITSLAAEYLEEERRIPEWEWLTHLNIQYSKLYISSVKLVDLARVADQNKKSAERFTPVLQEMQTTLEATIDHMKKYPAR